MRSRTGNRWTAAATGLGLAAALLIGASAGPTRAGEIRATHINDLFSLSPVEDDLYTATLGLDATFSGWTLGLEEYLFTDKGAGSRFDETYLTVARELIREDASPWSVRAEVGISHVGEGLFGQEIQNFVHRLINQAELFLTYVPEDRSYGFARVDVAYRVQARDRVVFIPRTELESAGFKRHALIALDTRWDLGGSVELRAEGGWRVTDTSFAPLETWVVESEPTLAVGLRYKHHVELTWTTNFFGTSDNHWHLGTRLRFGADTDNHR